MRILCYILVVLFVTTSAVGQQINPVPDYIFRNSMSVGRNAPTDTSAYFSIGPRFGATRGFMPPMVVDTAAVTGTKRNGLLIYSIQRNSYLYWDSTGNRWSRLASLSDTVTLSTRAWRQKGIDSVASVRIGGSGTINRHAKFTASGTLGNGGIADTASAVTMALTATNRVLINTTTDAGYQFDVAGSMRNTTNAYFATSSGGVAVGTTSVLSGDKLSAFGGSITAIGDGLNGILRAYRQGEIGDNNGMGQLQFAGRVSGGTSPTVGFRIQSAGEGTWTGSAIPTKTQFYNGTSNSVNPVRVMEFGLDGRVAIGDVDRVSAYRLRVGGGLRTDSTTDLAITTGNVGIGVALTGGGLSQASEKLDVNGRIRARTIDSSSSPINMLWSTATGVISKTAPPAFMVSSNATAAASWNFARDVTNSGNISRVTRTQDNAGDTTVTFHIAVYIATASFTTGSWVEVATLPTGYRPSEVVYGSLPDFVSGDVYEAQNGTDFAADGEYTGATVFRVLKDGKVQVRVATVTSSVTLSGTNNVLFPISFSFTIRPISV